MRRVLALLLLLAGTALAQQQVTSLPDPFVLPEFTIQGCCWWQNHGYTDTGGRTLRTTPLNTGIRNLVLIIDGQSLMESEAPTAYVTVNSAAIDNFNVYDGGLYPPVDPMLGTGYGTGLLLSGCGCGYIGGRIADLFITAGIFDRIILVPIAIGGTTVAQHASDGVLQERLPATMRRLASKGFTPQVNVTFAVVWGQGESGAQAGYQTNLASYIANGVAAGMSGRFFINRETWIGGVTNASIQAAQAAVVNGTNVFAGGDLDSLNASNRIADNTHLNDTGMANAATLIKNAMHASGAPY